MMKYLIFLILIFLFIGCGTQSIQEIALDNAQKELNNKIGQYTAREASPQNKVYQEFLQEIKSKDQIVLKDSKAKHFFKTYKNGFYGHFTLDLGTENILDLLKNGKGIMYPYISQKNDSSYFYNKEKTINTYEVLSKELNLLPFEYTESLNKSISEVNQKLENIFYDSLIIKEREPNLMENRIRLEKEYILNKISDIKYDYVITISPTFYIKDIRSYKYFNQLLKDKKDKFIKESYLNDISIKQTLEYSQFLNNWQQSILPISIYPKEYFYNAQEFGLNNSNRFNITIYSSNERVKFNKWFSQYLKDNLELNYKKEKKKAIARIQDEDINKLYERQVKSKIEKALKKENETINLDYLSDFLNLIKNQFKIVTGIKSTKME